MLSVLIPIYNFDVRPFVTSLSEQSQILDVPCEIICLDDQSEPTFDELNKEVSDLPNVLYSRSSVNLGRSKVRNALVELAKYDNLLILDCDGKVNHDDYLKRYVSLTDYDVVYGGRIYKEKRPLEPELHFHWYCGMMREAIEVHNRLKNPYKSFMTNNFLIRKAVYEDVLMDEEVVGYGHEDTLFAIDLKRKGYSILHIDNPVEHIGLETFDVFIEKSENGVRNLGQLMLAGKVDDSVKLIRYFNTLNRTGLIHLVSLFVLMFKGPMMNSLKGPAPNLVWFDLWKLAQLKKAL